MPQLSTLESSRSVARSPLSGSGTTVRSGTARVLLAWSPAYGAPGFGAGQVELEAEPDALAASTWTWRQPSGAGWAEAISGAGCSEVVLTAQLDDNLPAKHRVFELAEQLALQLSETQPVIRVRFLPSSTPGASLSEARLARRPARLRAPLKR